MTIIYTIVDLPMNGSHTMIKEAVTIKNVWLKNALDIMIINVAVILVHEWSVN